MYSIKHSHHTFEIDKKERIVLNILNAGSNEVILYNQKKWALISSLQKKDTSINNILINLRKEIN